MNLLDDVITYVRRIVKTPSNNSLSNNLIVDYINRFWIMDVDARMQLFDLETTYEFETTPGISDYNMPLYSSQTSSGSNPQAQIYPFPVYQGFADPVYANGIRLGFYTQQAPFYNAFPNYIQPIAEVATGDGATTDFSFTLPYFPCIPGHIDMSGIVYTGNNTDPLFGTTLTSIPSTSVKPGVIITYTTATGANATITDSGQFLSSSTDGALRGLLMTPGKPPLGDTSLGTYSTTSNTVNYDTGLVYVSFPSAPPDGTAIQAQCYFYQQGIPRGLLYFNNILRFRPPPNTQYLMSLQAYLTPAAFLTTSTSLPFAYMAEYIARGAARKILSDTGDVEQFQFYEPLFREQEMLVWRRSARIRASTQQPTIYNSLNQQSPLNNSVGVT